MSRVYIVLLLLAVMLMPLGAQALVNKCTLDDLDLMCPEGQALQGISGGGSKVCQPIPGYVSNDGEVSGPDGGPASFARCVDVKVEAVGSQFIRPQQAAPAQVRQYTVTFDTGGEPLSSAQSLIGLQSADFEVLGLTEFYEGANTIAVGAQDGWFIMGCGTEGNLVPNSNDRALYSFIRANHCMVQLEAPASDQIKNVSVVACAMREGD